ncbi:hypothetical protein EXM22_01990 [Oceanispirochaeta crateris]|uniref:Uncharacterized protein n=1 Tax=Oceanispirochaeta crateris TaxID=2518645 RepID=A0A5C1QGY8_9SPIO|nr:hypothetical protein [Oceanispirochaeta crateris]QEN06821.1 hypothetical protein EXM22_01990 [Oceanispirochaeta crateris]
MASTSIIESGTFIEEECWLRQPGETGAAYTAFCLYRDYGGSRSVRKVLKDQELPSSRSGIWLAWSQRYAWVLRAEKYDAHLDKIRLEENEKALRQRQAKHLELSKKMLDLVDKRLDKLDPDELSQGTILDWMKNCSQIETDILKDEEKEKGTLKQLEISFFEDFKGV